MTTAALKTQIETCRVSEYVSCENRNAPVVPDSRKILKTNLVITEIDVVKQPRHNQRTISKGNFYKTGNVSSKLVLRYLECFTETLLPFGVVFAKSSQKILNALKAAGDALRFQRIWATVW